MAIKLTNTEKPKPPLEAFLPPLLTFGPIFIVLGLEGTIGSQTLHWFGLPLAFIGSGMLSVGLGALYTKQARIEARLSEIERLNS